MIVYNVTQFIKCVVKYYLKCVLIHLTSLLSDINESSCLMSVVNRINTP